VTAAGTPTRVDPVAGTRLAAADLRDLLRLADHQRRRHVRALHDTWGVAAGLDLARSRERGFLVRPGIAYDRCARLMVLPDETVLPAGDPKRALAVVLRAGAREPEADLRLLDPRRVEPGVDVVLGVLASGGHAASVAGRRHARTAAPVQFAAGLAARGTLAATGTVESWTAEVDTTSAGFIDVPVYAAAVAAPRPGAGPAAVQVLEATENGFQVAVRRPVPGGDGAFDRTPLTTNPDDLTWLAALPQAAARPAPVVRPTGPCDGPPPSEEMPQ
jgi:hypothetical protein